MDLKNLIIKNNIAYRQGNPVISDAKYDKLLEILEDEMTQDEFIEFKKSLLDIPGKVKHNYVIGSLNKVKAETDEFWKWTKKEYIEHLLIMEKIDGMSIVLRYKNGHFIQAITRGDGEFGENQTEKIKHIVPQKLESFTGEIRAEIVLKESNFRKLTEIDPKKNHKNPRNSTVGIIGEKEINLEKIKLLSVVCYQILNSEHDITHQLEQLEKYGFDVVRYDSTPSITSAILHIILKVWKEEAEYDIDGLVICDSHYKNENTYYPKKMVAFKAENEPEISTVKDVEWEISKSGYLKPVILIEPVELNGTTVQRATAYNAKWLQENGIGVGTVIEIIKGGEIIPKIKKVISNKTTMIIDYCPCCGSSLSWHGVELKCENKYCEDKNVKLIESFLLKMNVEGISKTSLKNWNILSFDDLLDWKPDTSKKAQVKFYNDFINKVMNSSQEQIMASMYYDGAGRKTMFKLFDFYGFEKLNILMNVENEPNNFPSGIGLKTWNKIKKTWGSNYLLSILIIGDERYVYNNIDNEESNSDILDGKSFCFTGKLTKPRKEYEKMVKDNGGVIKGVSKKLDYLVAGEKAGSKLKKAAAMSIEIIDEDKFLSFIN